VKIANFVNFLVPLSMRQNKISTVVVGTSIVYTVKQGTRNLVRVSVVNSYFNNVTMKLDRAMSISYFDSRRMGVPGKKHAWPITHCSMTSFGGHAPINRDRRIRCSVVTARGRHFGGHVVRSSETYKGLDVDIQGSKLSNPVFRIPILGT
jgi:hypothetical protein